MIESELEERREQSQTEEEQTARTGCRLYTRAD